MSKCILKKVSAGWYQHVGSAGSFEILIQPHRMDSSNAWSIDRDGKFLALVETLKEAREKIAKMDCQAEKEREADGKHQSEMNLLLQEIERHAWRARRLAQALHDVLNVAIGRGYDEGERKIRAMEVFEEAWNEIHQREGETEPDIRTMPIEEVRAELAREGIDPEPLIRKVKGMVAEMQDPEGIDRQKNHLWGLVDQHIYSGKPLGEIADALWDAGYRRCDSAADRQEDVT